MLYLCIVSERDDSTLLSLKPPDTIVMATFVGFFSATVSQESVDAICYNVTYPDTNDFYQKVYDTFGDLVEAVLLPVEDVEPASILNTIESPRLMALVNIG